MIWLLAEVREALGLTVSAQQRGKRFGLPAEIWPVELLPNPEGFIHG